MVFVFQHGPCYKAVARISKMRRHDHSEHSSVSLMGGPGKVPGQTVREFVPWSWKPFKPRKTEGCETNLPFFWIFKWSCTNPHRLIARIFSKRGGSCLLLPQCSYGLELADRASWAVDLKIWDSIYIQKLRIVLRCRLLCFWTSTIKTCLPALVLISVAVYWSVFIFNMRVLWRYGSLGRHARRTSRSPLVRASWRWSDSHWRLRDQVNHAATGSVGSVVVWRPGNRLVAGHRYVSFGCRTRTGTGVVVCSRHRHVTRHLWPLLAAAAAAGLPGSHPTSLIRWC